MGWVSAICRLSWPCKLSNADSESSIDYAAVGGSVDSCLNETAKMMVYVFIVRMGIEFIDALKIGDLRVAKVKVPTLTKLVRLYWF